MMFLTTFAVGCSAGSPQTPPAGPRCLFIAHSGESLDAPENTLASIHLAWERNVDAVEVDVHPSKDGRIVVIHDHNTRRTGGCDKDVGDQTLQELKRLDVGAWKGEKWIGQRIPTLGEALKTVPEGQRIFVELKCGAEVLDELQRVVTDSSLRAEQVVFICFELATIEAVKKRLPGHEAYWLSNFREDRETGAWAPTAEQLIDGARRAGLDGLDVRACGAVDEAFIEEVRSAGLSIWVWTVNEPVEAKRLMEAGVNGITSDRAQWLRERLATPSAPPGRQVR